MAWSRSNSLTEFMTGWKEHSSAIDNSDQFKRVIAGILDSNAPTEMSFSARL